MAGSMYFLVRPSITHLLPPNVDHKYEATSTPAAGRVPGAVPPGTPFLAGLLRLGRAVCSLSRVPLPR